jgi:hypothetical protein
MNKGLLIVFMLAFGLAACNSTNETKEKKVTADIIDNPVTASGDYSTEDLPKIEFNKTTHDFGLIIEGEKVIYTFTYTNTGKSDLIIKSASASCGCTVPTFSREPIAPGEQGKLEVVFDSNGRSGKQHKTVTVLSNCIPNTLKLAITGEIVEP